MLRVTADMVPLSAEAVQEATGGVLVRGCGVCSGVSTDSRSLRPGELFVAIRGRRADGHAFLAGAVARGAEGLVVDREPDGATGAGFVVVVPDTRRALLDLAAWHRARLAARVVAITGSCGKTSTKEIAAHLLRGQRSLVAAERSFNNEIGVPRTLFRAGPTTEVCLVEIGTSAPGEVAALARVVAPDIALVTAIGRAHLAGLGSVDGVLREKGALLEALPGDGICVLDAGAPYFGALRARAPGRRLVTYAVDRDADLRAEALRQREGGVRFRIRRRDGGADLDVDLPRPGLHDVRNLLAALGIGIALGVEPGDMVDDVASLPATPRRLEAKRTAAGLRVLDDSYNANPDSLRAALAVLDAAAGRRKVLVLGDMLELGAEAEGLHRAVAPWIAGVDVLVTVGPLAALAAEAFAARGGSATSFPDVDALLPELRSLLRRGDLVLFKGSRAVALDRAADSLTGDLRAPFPDRCSTTSSDT